MADHDDDHSKTIRVISYSGDQEDWDTWCRKWKAYANLQGFMYCFSDVELPDTQDQVLDLTVAANVTKH